MNKSEEKNLLSSFHGNILNINNSWCKMLSRKKQKNTFIVGQLMNSVDTMSATAETLRVKVFRKCAAARWMNERFDSF